MKMQRKNFECEKYFLIDKRTVVRLVRFHFDLEFFVFIFDTFAFPKWMHFPLFLSEKDVA